jgi:hypothetical protein
VTYSTSGLAPGDVLTMALQAPSTISTTGRYGYRVLVQGKRPANHVAGRHGAKGISPLIAGDQWAEGVPVVAWCSPGWGRPSR